MESIVEVGRMQCDLINLHKSVTDSISSDDDEVFEAVLERLEKLQDKLMNLGTDVNEKEIQTFRKVTINETQEN